MAVRFDAASDRISYSGALPDPVDGFTATFWAYLSVDRDDFSTFLRLWAGAGSSTTITAQTIDNGITPGYFTAGGSVLSSTSLSVGSWHRIAVTCGGTTANVYSAEGSEGITSAASGTVAGTANPTGITVGGRSPSDASEWFNGRIAHLKIWSRVLTQAQVEAEWRIPTPVVVTDLQAYWPLASAGDLTDHSGNGRHLVAGTTAVATEDDPPIEAADVYTKTGGAAGYGAGIAGAPTIEHAEVFIKTGGASGFGAGSGFYDVDRAHVKTGGAAGFGAGRGSVTVVKQLIKAGGAAGWGAGTGSVVVLRTYGAVHAGTPEVIVLARAGTPTRVR